MNTVDPNVWSFLRERTTCFVIKPNTVITRCPYCGDSRRKLYNYGHLYISLSVPFFICFRCNERGHIKKLLKTFISKNICTTEEAKLVLQAYEGKTVNFKTINTTSSIITRNLTYKLNDHQYAYVRDRINSDFDPKLYNIVSPDDLMENSNFMSLNSPIVKKLHQNKHFLSDFKSNYVAFISLLRTVVVFRRITQGEPRYIQIYTDNHDPYDVYCPDASKPFDLTKFDTFIIAEGVFDILNHNVSLNRKGHCRLAVFGKARLSKGLDILHSYFVEPKHIILYLDKDVIKDRFTLNMLQFAYKDTAVKFFYNKLGKDMGEQNVLIQEYKPNRRSYGSFTNSYSQ